MAEPTIKQRLADLRRRLSDLEWEAARVVEVADDPWRQDFEIQRVQREIERAEEYERLGYEHEPNF